MKRFKDFIKPKEEFITNSHGKHASISPSKAGLKESTRRKDLNTDFLKSHGAHGNWEESNKQLNDQMEKLHHDHPHNDEAIDHFGKFTSGSREFTESLLNDHNYNTGLEDDHKELMHGLDKHGFLPAKHKLDTYSGVGFDIHHVKPVGKSKEGNKVYHQPTYMSSSTDRDVARSFADDSREDYHHPAHIFHWHHNEHDPIGVVGNHSQYPEEREVLVPRTGSTPHKYHIEHLGTEKYTGENISGDKVDYHIHHVRRIPESEIQK